MTPPDIIPVAPVAATWLQTWLPLVAIVVAFIGAISAPMGVALYNGRLAAANALKAAEATRRMELKLVESTSRTDEKLNRIDSMVDGRLTEALKKIDRLESRLQDVTGSPHA
jgi:hypothetical protein